MKETVFITGHKNPDSDSICSAIAYAEYKNTLGDVKAIPVRLGNINRETDFILNYFGVKLPMLLETVKLSVEDLDFDVWQPTEGVPEPLDFRQSGCADSGRADPRNRRRR